MNGSGQVSGFSTSTPSFTVIGWSSSFASARPVTSTDMPKRQSKMRFSCHFDYYPEPWDPQFFINPVTVDVLCGDENGNDCLVARMAIDHLDLIRAETSGQDVLDVCDADSAGWEAVYSALFEPGEDFVELRRDFNFNDPVLDVLFLHRSAFHRSIYDLRMFIVDHAACLFGETTALVMWNSETGIPDSDLAKLGFRKIAGHELLFRPNMLVNAYDRANDAARILDIEVSSSAAKEVEDEWSTKSKR